MLKSGRSKRRYLLRHGKILSYGELFCALLLAIVSLPVSTFEGCARQVSLDEKLFQLNQRATGLLEMRDRLAEIANSIEGELENERFEAIDHLEKLKREEEKLKQIHEHTLAMGALPGFQEKAYQLIIAALATWQTIAATRCFIFFQSASVGSEPLFYSLAHMWEECLSETRHTLDIFLGNAPDPYGSEEWYGWLLVEYFETAKAFYPLYYWDFDQGIFDTDKERLDQMLIYLRTNLQRALKDIYRLEIPDYWDVPYRRLKELVECMVGQSLHLLELPWPMGEDQAELVDMRFRLSGLVQNFFDELESRKLPRE